MIADSYHTWRCVLLLRVCTTQICPKTERTAAAETAAAAKKGCHY